MRKLLIAAFLTASAFAAGAQDSTTVLPPPPPPPVPQAPMIPKLKSDLNARSNDHFLMQLGYTAWTNKPDSVHTKGFSRSFNMYLMLDFPFKSNPHFSVALGPGIATDNVFFDQTYIGIKDATPTIRFKDVSGTDHFKKYKLATAYAELPVELRYRFKTDDDAKAVKLALGIKVGQLLNAHVKGKTLQNSSGTTIGSYIEKENSKYFLNRTRIAGQFRLGYGHFSAFASYSLTPVFKEGLGPQVKPLTIGLTLSGL